MPKHFGEMSLTTLLELIEEKINYLKELINGKAESNHTHSQYLTSHQDLSAYAKTTEVNSKLSGYATNATITALEKRVKDLEDALGGLSFVTATSAPTTDDENIITIVDV